ncbi:MAG: carboxymuconolactone decarboxylase family protein [Bryobacteraceae bacterium]|nr:carboxymuconolactone decarboxylase family protein [Bryobacteraceae bacterium]
MKTKLPKAVRSVQKSYPKVWAAFENLGKECHEAGPLDEKTRRLAKLAIAIGAGHEGAVHSAVRQARAAGVKPEAMYHVAVLSITTIGWPAAQKAFTWISDNPKD